MFLVGFVLYIRSLVSYVCFVGHCLSFYLLNLLNSGFQNWLLLVPLLRTLQLCQFLLCFYFRPLCCLFFFDLRILITPMLSSNSSSQSILLLAIPPATKLLKRGGVYWFHHVCPSVRLQTNPMSYDNLLLMCYKYVDKSPIRTGGWNCDQDK